MDKRAKRVSRRLDWVSTVAIGQRPPVAIGTKDLLWCSVLERSAVSRPLRLLLCSIRVRWSRWSLLSTMPDGLVHNLLSTTTKSS